MTLDPIDAQIEDFIRSRYAADRRGTLPHFKVLTTYTPQSFLPYFYNLVCVMGGCHGARAGGVWRRRR